MSVSKRGGVYWYEFWFHGQRCRASTGLNNKTAALRAEAIRKAELAEGRAGIRARKATPFFEKLVNDEFLPWAKNEHRAHPSTYVRYSVSAKALVPFSASTGWKQFRRALSRDSKFHVQRIFRPLAQTGI